MSREKKCLIFTIFRNSPDRYSDAYDFLRAIYGRPKLAKGVRGVSEAFSGGAQAAKLKRKTW